MQHDGGPEPTALITIKISARSLSFTEAVWQFATDQRSINDQMLAFSLKRDPYSPKQHVVTIFQCNYVLHSLI